MSKKCPSSTGQQSKNKNVPPAQASRAKTKMSLQHRPAEQKKNAPPAQASRATTRTKNMIKLDENSNNVIISKFAPGFNDQVAKNIITNLYQIYFRERGQENIEINVYNKNGELIV